MYFLNGKSLADRTSELRGKGYEGRRLGPKQMTTDTAVRVARMVVQEQGKSRPIKGMNFRTCDNQVEPGFIFRPFGGRPYRTRSNLISFQSSHPRRDTLPRLSRAETRRAREHADAVPIRPGRGWKAGHARGKHDTSSSLSLSLLFLPTPVSLLSSPRFPGKFSHCSHLATKPQI